MNRGLTRRAWFLGLWGSGLASWLGAHVPLPAKSAVPSPIGPGSLPPATLSGLRVTLVYDACQRLTCPTGAITTVTYYCPSSRARPAKDGGC